MAVLITRNIKLYFRDKANFLFSLLAVFIILALYVLFLENVWGNEQIRALPDADVLRSSWLASGTIAVATVTTSMGAFSVIVDDRSKKIYKGFYAAPVKRSHITGGYIFSAFIIGTIMSIITAVFWSVYIFFMGGEFLSAAAYLKIFGLILISSLSSTAMVCFLVTFTKTHSAFGTASTILGTLIGFLMGIYLPIGTLPDAVQTIIKLFPPSHAAMLLRQTLMEIPIQHSFDGIPAEYITEFKEIMGITFRFGDFEITPVISVLCLAVSAAVFYSLSLYKMRKGN